MIIYNRVILLIFAMLFLNACNTKENQSQTASTEQIAYFKDSSKGIKTGGIKIVEITTPKGKFKVWTKTVGNNPKIKVLLLNGGPGATHEYFECMESFLPAEGIEFIYYDQLGTGNSENPNDPSFWDLPRFVDEVEQVRKALNLDKDNFYLLGHSWGGILAAEYALKYQEHLKGLIISNMMMSAIDYSNYSEVLAKQMNPDVLSQLREIEKNKDYKNPKYMELLIPNFYAKHIIRMNINDWPEPLSRSFAKINESLYVTMQGPSEFGISGKLEKWDIKNQISKISVPTLSIGAKYDTMDPKHMQWIASEVQNGTYLYCDKGSHMSMYDDQQTYMKGLIKFIKDTDKASQKL
ncbi:proline iminopeptidase-family hydrolase [Flavobacterium sp. SH_e]|uniref:proline iminopeptidase-family hydrolase n=1 Tax=Flavobacterium sp. SH_e TaxID=2983767 RepID=UPI0021E40E4C|nr:proline iminopeptidase-family hydrolase [Flavobacterium sp. SH_e]MCV2484775.1 proline iminopeptidase-family hydrolase [Flavobacterium sp. SH_e]